MNRKFLGDALEDFLEALVVGKSKVGRHAYSDQQHGNSARLRHFNHLPQVIGALAEFKAAQAVVSAEFDDLVGGIVLFEQGGQALDTAEGGLAADAGIDHACLWEIRPHVNAEQMRPTLVDLNIVSGTQTVA